jgi:hypothetical protein
MSIKLNGAQNGSIQLDVPAAIGSDVTGVLLPTAAGTLDRLERTGNILQVVTSNHQFLGNNNMILVSKDTTAAGALYSSTVANRAYGDLASVTITPTYANSVLLISAQAGMSSTTRSDRGAQGIVIVKDNASIYDNSVYPQYDALNLQQSYESDQTIAIAVPAVNTNAQTFYLKGFAYNENDGSTTHIARFISHSLSVMEVKA